MNAISLGHAAVVLISLWAIAGAIRYPRETLDAGRAAKAWTGHGLARFTDPGGAVAAGHVAAEIAAHALAFLVGFAATAGYALGGDAVRAIRRRAPGPRPASPRRNPLPTHPALTVEAANVVDGETVSDDTDAPAPADVTESAPTSGPTADRPPMAERGDIEDAVIVEDPDDPTATPTTTAKGTPVSELDTTTSTPELSVATAASTTLGQAKRDLAAATEAGALVGQWTNGQTVLAGVRHETGTGRAAAVAALAEQAARAASWAQSSAEAAAGQGVDSASVHALAAAAAQFAAVSQSAGAAAAQAATIAADEANIAETFHRIIAQMQDAAALADHARNTLAAQQDAHAAAYAQTNHTGADGSYLADAA